MFVIPNDLADLHFITNAAILFAGILYCKCIFCSTLLLQEEKGRVMRRTIMRYCCLSLTMAFTLISPRVKKRFPTMDHLIEAGSLF